jgi:hypothetical protein
MLLEVEDSSMVKVERVVASHRRVDGENGAVDLERTRTAWAVFKYCGTKTAPLRRNFF